VKDGCPNVTTTGAESSVSRSSYLSGNRQALTKRLAATIEIHVSL